MARKVLIIEDESDYLDFLRMRLESCDYEVVGACDGKDGFEKTFKENPDIILLDLMLPKIDGYWVCNILKHDKRYSNIPIIIISAKSQQENIDLAKECGADAYLIKPFEFEDLLLKMASLLK